MPRRAKSLKEGFGINSSLDDGFSRLPTSIVFEKISLKNLIFILESFRKQET